MRSMLVWCAIALASGGAEANSPVRPRAPAQVVHHHRRHGEHWPLPAAGRSESGDPEVIFTFDDGPNPRTTPAVLDALARHHVHAVFFEVGEMAARKRAAAVIARIVRDGDIIGNHTMHHPNLCLLRSDARAGREIDDATAVIVRTSGLIPAWLRSPYGVRCHRVDRLLAARGLRDIHWDLDPQEWKTKSTKKTIAYVERHLAHMRGRNVLLMHDIKKVTVRALPVILAWIDRENARRIAAHRRPIRIVAGDELAAEQLPPGLVGWLGELAPGRREIAGELARVVP